MNSSYQLLKNCAPPEPLTGGNEYKLCAEGFRLNFLHAEAQLKEAAAMNAEPGVNRQEQFEHLKAAVTERHEIIRAQFSHVEDCFICSVAFGLTPAPEVKAPRKPFAQFLARLIRAVRFSKLKAGLQRV